MTERQKELIEGKCVLNADVQDVDNEKQIMKKNKKGAYNMVTIYTQNTCPKCGVLKKKLDLKNIEYSECQDIKTMEELAIAETPVLQVDDTFLIYSDAVKWVNRQ